MTNYDDLYNGVPVGLWRTNIVDGKFLHANDATLNILGFSSFEELSQYASADFYDRKVRDNLIKELLEVGEVTDLTFIMQKKDRTEITVSVSAKIFPDKGYLEGTIQDITGSISLEALCLPHLEKMSLLKQDIIKKINEDDCDYHKISKSA